MNKQVGVILLLMVFIFSACGSRVDNNVAMKYIKHAEEVVDHLNNQNYEAVYDEFNREMQASLHLEDMNQLTDILEQAGTFEEIEKKSVDEKDGYYVTVLVAKYSEASHVFTITFTKDDEIAGLYIK